VPTLDGSAEVTVPPGTQPWTVLRLAGKGLPVFSGPGRGDLYLRINVQVPIRLSPDQQSLYQQLIELEKPQK
ncbi:J domain-containing protein, partial [bacterium]|nr:J domain-containing protein [bacterium]